MRKLFNQFPTVGAFGWFGAFYFIHESGADQAGGEGDDADAQEGDDATYEFAHCCDGVNVAVAYSGEGGYTGSGLFVGGDGLVDDTGQRVAGVVHQDEWVAPAWMVDSPKFADTIIGYLEAARREGGYRDGGVAAPAQGAGGVGPAGAVPGMGALEAKLDRLIELFEALPHIIEVQNSIVDTVEKIEQYNVLREKSRIG